MAPPRDRPPPLVRELIPELVPELVPEAPHRPSAPARDEALAARAAAGDAAAFEALVVHHGGALLAALERLGLDSHAAEDAAQEAWVRVYRALADYDPTRPLRPWLFGIALNLGRDALRRRGTRQSVSAADDALRDLGVPDHAARQLAEQSAIDHALSQVEAPFREALALVDVGGLDYDEAAAVLGVAVGTVKSRVHRGRDAFRAAYRKSETRQGAQRS